MTREEKKGLIIDMAENFMKIKDLEVKSIAIIAMMAYIEGKAAGKAEERARLEARQQSATA